MNIFQWLKDKAGKLPVTVAQAAGLTAVVGAAGFAAMSYLNAPVDNGTTFMPPTQGGEVVFVSQNAGGGGYESNGEIGSAFKAAPSRAIQLANRQAVRAEQAQALEEASASAQPAYGAPEADSTELVMPKAANLGGADFNLGLGGNKDVTGTFAALTSAQNQLKGINDMVNAQVGGASVAAGTNVPGASAPGTAAPAGKPAALASAPRDWSKGATGASGGSSGGSNAFVIQNSGKNARGSAAAAPSVEVGDAIAQAQAAMKSMQEGTRMQSRANFGKFDGNLGNNRETGPGRSRRMQQMGNELKTLRKQSADIAKSKTKSANEGAAPFLASARISGGLTVSGDNITIGQDASSGDLNRADQQIRGIKAGLKGVGDDLDKQQLVRDELKNWLLTEFTTALGGLVGIAVLVKAAKGPWAPVLLALAAVLAAALAVFIWWGTIAKISAYNGACGSDGWTAFGWGLAGILTACIPLAWIFGPKVVGEAKGLTAILMPVLGFGGVGFGIADLASGDDSGVGDDVDGEEEK